MDRDNAQASDGPERHAQSLESPAAPPPEEGFRLRSFLNGSVALDVVVPIVVYQAMVQLFGVPRVPALVVSGAFPAVNVVRRYVRDRRVDPIGVIVLLSILVGAAVSLVSGSEKLTLLRESFLTAAFGVAFLASLAIGKPIMFLLIRQFVAQEDDRRLAEWDALWRDEPEFRRVMRQMTAMWGIVLLSEFGLKVLMIETLSTDVVQACSGPLLLAVIAILIVVSIRWGRRARERGEGAAR